MAALQHWIIVTSIVLQVWIFAMLVHWNQGASVSVVYLKVDGSLQPQEVVRNIEGARLITTPKEGGELVQVIADTIRTHTTPHPKSQIKNTTVIHTEEAGEEESGGGGEGVAVLGGGAVVCRGRPNLSQHPKFVVTLCANDTTKPDMVHTGNLRETFGCQGYFRVHKRVGCTKPTDVQFSNDPQYTQLARNRGPDTFYVRLLGPEILALRVEYGDGNDCKYKAYFQVQHSGSYSISLEWVYTNFDAYNEKDIKWQPLLNHTLIQLDTVVLTCDDSTPVDTYTYKEREQECNDVEGSSSAGGGQGGGGGVMSLSGGRWIGFYSISPSVPPKLPPLMHYGWQPDKCTFPKYSPSDMAECLKGRKLLFLGDSQVRATFIQLVDLINKGLQQNGEGLPSSKLPKFEHHEDTRVKLPTKNSPETDIVVDYCVDPYLYRLVNYFNQDTRIKFTQLIPNWLQATTALGHREWPKGNEYDYIIICVGQHFSSHTHYTFKSFQRAVQAALEAYKTTTRSKARLIWMTLPSIVPRNDQWVKQVGDWRNNGRFSLMNDWLIQTLLATKLDPVINYREKSRKAVSLVDYFGPTFGMLFTTTDDSHYRNFVQDNVLRQIIHNLCA